MEPRSDDTFVVAIRNLCLDRSDDEAWRQVHDDLFPRLFATSSQVLRGNRILAEYATHEALSRMVHVIDFDNFAKTPEALRSFALAVCRTVSLLYLEQVEKNAKPWAMPALRFSVLEQFSLQIDAKTRGFLDLILEGYTLSKAADRLGLAKSAAVLSILRLRSDLSGALKAP